MFRAINRCDNYVFYDDVQYERKSWQNTVKIQGTKLVVPVVKAPLHTLISDIEIADKNFYEQHLETIEKAYAAEPYTKHVVAWLDTIFKNAVRDKSLYGVTETLIQALTNYLGLKTHFARSTNLNIKGTKTGRLVNICKHFGATTYLSPIGSKDYLEVEQFEQAGIEVEWNIVPGGEINGLSIVDYMVRLTPEEIRKLL